MKKKQSVMKKRQITSTEALITTLPEERALTMADAARVELVLVENRRLPDGQWVNEFEVTGSPEAVEIFIGKVKDVEMR